MELVLTNNENGITTTSLELVAYINYLRKQEGVLVEIAHSDFLKKVKEVLKLGAGKFSFSYKSSQNKDLPMYVFPKREAMLMAMSYSYDIQAVVYDSWELAEAALLKTTKISLPDFTNPAEAAKAWAVEYEQKQEAKFMLEQANNALEEAAEFVQAYNTISADEETTYNMSEAAKVLDVKPHTFIKWLRDNKYTTNGNVAMQVYVTGGILVHKYSTYRLPNGEYPKPVTLVTNKGITHFQKKIAKGLL